jgi:glutamate synthase domain-containing protein 3
MTTTSIKTLDIDAAGVYYRDLNTRLREAVNNGVEKISLRNVHGQRYIGTDLNKPVEIEIAGTPGNDLGAFMNGPRLTVRGNAQDGCGNTMNAGEIIIHGRAGDTAGLSARGGKIFVKEDVGYRTGIHMKEYQGKKPVIVIGGTAQDFAGEYMAGGVMILLGLNLAKGENHRSKYVGTGMHGGVIYLRGSIPRWQLGKEVDICRLNEEDNSILSQYVSEFAGHFSINMEEIMAGDFLKLYPRWLRPYGRLYAY